jgi:hypothetical protein
VHFVELARRVGCVGKALSYQAALGESSPSLHAEYEFPVRDWLLGLLDHSPG